MVWHSMLCSTSQLELLWLKIQQKYAKNFSINMQNMHKSMYWHILHIYALHSTLCWCPAVDGFLAPGSAPVCLSPGWEPSAWESDGTAATATSLAGGGRWPRASTLRRHGFGLCSQYLLSKFQKEEDGQDEVDYSTGEPEVPAVNEDANATHMQISICIYMQKICRNMQNWICTNMHF